LVGARKTLETTGNSARDNPAVKVTGEVGRERGGCKHKRLYGRKNKNSSN